MSGRFYIDGKDAFTEYGIYVQEGGYNELVAYPPRKLSQVTIGRKKTV